jgi:hypothetical protein
MPLRSLLRPLIAIALLLPVASLQTACTAVAKRPERPSAIPEVARRLTGSFSSEAQAKEDPEFLDVRLHMARIWASRTDGPWIYVEQAMATALDKPYRQRVYRLVDRGDGTVESLVYELENPADRVGAWRDPSRFDADSPGSLALRDGCSIVLERAGDAWIGSTNERDCESSLRGARYATSEVVLIEPGLDTWDRGFDAEGKQVWGATKGPYRFRRVAD